MIDKPYWNTHLISRAAVLCILCVLGGWAGWHAQGTKAVELTELTDSEDAIGEINALPKELWLYKTQTKETVYSVQKLLSEMPSDRVRVKRRVSGIQCNEYKILSITYQEEKKKGQSVRAEFQSGPLPLRFFEVGDQLEIIGNLKKSNQGEIVLIGHRILIEETQYQRDPELYGQFITFVATRARTPAAPYGQAVQDE